MENMCFFVIRFVISVSLIICGEINLAGNSYENLNSIQSNDRSEEIVSLTWVNQNTGERGEHGDLGDETELLCGLVNKQLKLYDSVSASFTDLFKVEGGQGKICGLEILPNANILTCVESGLVKFWSLEGTSKTDGDISVGSNVCRMRKSPIKSNVFATCGKDNPLKMWDINNPQSPMFTSKNVKNNWLDLRSPVWDTDLRFLPDSNSDLIVTCTRHHFIRLYDLRAGRRPSLQIDWQQDPFTTLSLCCREKQVVAGTNRGFLGLFDLRSPGKLIHALKGFAGHINCVEAHPTQPYVASCGLDRFFRLHNLNDKKLLNKIYCKSHLNTLLMRKNLSIFNIDDDVSEKNEENSKLYSNSCDKDVDDLPTKEDVWSNMKKVGQQKKRELSPSPNDAADAEKLSKKRFKKHEKRHLSSEDDEEIYTVQPSSKKRKKIPTVVDKKRKKSGSNSDSDSRKSPDAVGCPIKLKSKFKKRQKTKKFLTKLDVLDVV